MLNRRFLLAGLIVILFGLTSVIQVTARDGEKNNVDTATGEELMQLKGRLFLTLSNNSNRRKNQLGWSVFDKASPRQNAAAVFAWCFA